MSSSPKKRISQLKFLLDENVDVRLASFLKERGSSVIITPKGLKNGAVATLARQEKCVLLTNDRDFANQDLFKPSDFYGIVVFRIHPPTFLQLKSALTKLLEKFPPEKLNSRTFLLSEKGIEVIK